MMAKLNPMKAPAMNRFLARLTDADFRFLAGHLQPIEFSAGEVLYETGGLIRHAYFPAGAVLSVIQIMEDGKAIEVATVGNEGLIGHGAALRGKPSTNRVIVQVEGMGMRLDVAVLKGMIEKSAPLRSLLADYQDAFLSQVFQSVACNGLHNLEQRCCRWLLMTRVRVGSDDIRLSHEFLATMLGARRASVTDALRPLREAGLVRSHRGKVSLLDPAGLERRACECFRVVKDEYDRLLNVNDHGKHR